MAKQPKPKPAYMLLPPVGIRKAPYTYPRSFGPKGQFGGVLYEPAYWSPVAQTLSSQFTATPPAEFAPGMLLPKYTVGSPPIWCVGAGSVTQVLPESQ